MVEVTYITNLNSILTIILSSAAVGGIVWHMGRWINKRADAKAAALATTLEEKHVSDKIDRDKIASDMRIQIDENAQKGREVSAALAETVRDASNKHYNELATKLIVLEDKVNQRIEKVDSKVMDMLNSLSKRSDLVNGNIANIRADIADLQEDISDIGLDNESPTNTKTRKRAMRLKRRRIEADRVAQAEV